MAIDINICDIGIGINFGSGIRIGVRFDISHIHIDIDIKATRLDTGIQLDTSPVKRNHRTRCGERRSFICHRRGPILSVETEQTREAQSGARPGGDADAVSLAGEGAVRVGGRGRIGSPRARHGRAVGES